MECLETTTEKTVLFEKALPKFIIFEHNSWLHCEMKTSVGNIRFIQKDNHDITKFLTKINLIKSAAKEQHNWHIYIDCLYSPIDFEPTEQMFSCRLNFQDTVPKELVVSPNQNYVDAIHFKWRVNYNQALENIDEIKKHY